jgi:hypothetical protein
VQLDGGGNWTHGKGNASSCENAKVDEWRDYAEGREDEGDEIQRGLSAR